MGQILALFCIIFLIFFAMLGTEPAQNTHSNTGHHHYKVMMADSSVTVIYADMTLCPKEKVHFKYGELNGAFEDAQGNLAGIVVEEVFQQEDGR